MQCQQLVYFLTSLKRKIEHVYISAGWRDKESLSLSLSLSLWRKTELARVIEPYMFICLWNVQNVDKISWLWICRACAKSCDGARGSNWFSDHWLWRQISYYIHSRGITVVGCGIQNIRYPLIFINMISERLMILYFLSDKHFPRSREHSKHNRSLKKKEEI